MRIIRSFRLMASIASVFAIATFGCQEGRCQVINTSADITGYYSLEGKVDQAFRNIDVVVIQPSNDGEGKPTTASLHGFIRLKRTKQTHVTDFTLKDILLDGREFSFQTKSINGVSYQFKGEFSKLGNFPEDRPDGEIILRRALTIFRPGKEVTHSKVQLSYFGGD